MLDTKSTNIDWKFPCVSYLRLESIFNCVKCSSSCWLARNAEKWKWSSWFDGLEPGDAVHIWGLGSFEWIHHIRMINAARRTLHRVANRTTPNKWNESIRKNRRGDEKERRKEKEEPVRCRLLILWKSRRWVGGGNGCCYCLSAVKFWVSLWVLCSPILAGC